MDDWELLREYAETGSEAAFAELVSRHIDWVYGVSRRRVVDPALAEDVTQAVFIVLAKKAKNLVDGVVLVGWLMNAVHFASADALKRQARRRKHEQRAAAMNLTESSEADDDADLIDIAPQIDAALNQLPESYREAIALRFYCQRTYAEIAAVLGVNESNAKKRVSRGINKLRTLLRGKAGLFTVASLTAALATTAPPALKAQVISAAAGQTGAAMVIAHSTWQLLELAKLKIVIPLAVAALGISAVTLIVAHFSDTNHSATPANNSLGPIATVTPALSSEPVAVWPQFDHSLLRFKDQGGAFEQFQLTMPIQALPGRDIAPVQVAVQRKGESAALLVTVARDVLPYAYVANGLLVQLDDELPGGLVVATGVEPALVMRAQDMGGSLTNLSVAAARDKQIDVDLGSYLKCLQAKGASFNRDQPSMLRFLSSQAGGRFVLRNEPQPGQPPVSAFCVTEYVRLAVQIREIEVGAASTSLPPLTLRAIERLGVSVRQIGAPLAERDLLPRADVFDNPEQRRTAEKLQALIQNRQEAARNLGRLASTE